MKGQMDTQYGKILIDEDVIATYAGSVAVECFGIVGMAAVNMKDGLVKLLKKDYLTHGISVVVEEDNIVLPTATIFFIDTDSPFGNFSPITSFHTCSAVVAI